MLYTGFYEFGINVSTECLHVQISNPRVVSEC